MKCHLNQGHRCSWQNGFAHSNHLPRAKHRECSVVFQINLLITSKSHTHHIPAGSVFRPSPKFSSHRSKELWCAFASAVLFDIFFACICISWSKCSTIYKALMFYFLLPRHEKEKLQVQVYPKNRHCMSGRHVTELQLSGCKGASRHFLPSLLFSHLLTIFFHACLVGHVLSI